MGTLHEPIAVHAAPEEVGREALSWLLATGRTCLIALVLGSLAARAMRRRHLHWSWAALAVTGPVILRASLGTLALPLVIAAARAALLGRRWHRHDVEAGCDLAELAAERRRPSDLLGTLARTVTRRVPSLPSSTSGERAEVEVGHDRRGRPVSIPFADGSHAGHALVLGATGSGKTVTQTILAEAAVQRGLGAIVVDPKGDEAMRERLAEAATGARRAYFEWRPGGDCVYNPLARGGETEIADKVLAAERFTEPHYLRQAQRYLGHVVRALRAAGLEVSLARVAEHLDPASLERLARRLADDDALPIHGYLDSLSSRQISDLSGVRDRLAILVESDVGPRLDPDSDGCKRVDLLAAVRERAIVYFALESDRRPLLSQMLGAAIVQDLQTIVAALQRQPVPTLVLIDEFSAVAAEQVVRLFGRSRSAGFNLLLGTQELADLRLPGSHGLLEQVLGNLSVVIAHRQVLPGSAELVASMAGTRGTWQSSHHSDGRATRTRRREGVLDPSEVMHLSTGWAATIALGRSGGARVTHISTPAWLG